MMVTSDVCPASRWSIGAASGELGARGKESTHQEPSFCFEQPSSWCYRIRSTEGRGRHSESSVL